jgi:hypothetical protein
MHDEMVAGVAGVFAARGPGVRATRVDFARLVYDAVDPGAPDWDAVTAASFLSRHSSALALLVEARDPQRPGGKPPRTYAFWPPTREETPL